jgi:hypothetical protein
LEDQPPLWRCIACATGIDQLRCMTNSSAPTRDSDRVRPYYFGCTFGFPPGEPGGGMTLSSPPAGGVFCISGSTPAGGHMTPFESAS